MMKGLAFLLTRGYNASYGNHSVEYVGDVRRFRYHNNIVCIVNDKTKVFKLDDCGWAGYSSTTRTLNDYRKYFTKQGYEEIKEENYEL